jgi:CubicO group peptidase (beta-lactamase class C family)
VRAALAAPPTIEANPRFKYSNHVYGLLGLVVEAVTGEPYGAWIRRAIVTPPELRETEPDMPASSADRWPAVTAASCRSVATSSFLAPTQPTHWRRRPAS